MVQRRDKNTYPESRLIATIKKRKVCSFPTSDQLEEIRSAKGSDRLIDIIKENAPPLVPKPPDPLQTTEVTAKLGKLIVTCSVDCDVLVNGDGLGRTNNKTLSKELPIGKMVVAAVRENYVPEKASEVVDLKSDENAVLSFTFRPTRLALEVVGSKLFQEMAKAMNFSAFDAPPAIVGKNGTLSYFEDGKKQQWRFSAQIQASDRTVYSVELIFKERAQFFEVVRKEGKFDWTKKPPKGLDITKVNEALELLERYQLFRTVHRFQDPSFKMVASELSPSTAEGVDLSAESGGEVYGLKIDTARRLRQVILESGGWDKGTTIRYADYVEQASFGYPKRIFVDIPSTKVGISAEFEDVEIQRGTK